jgi:magnesium transporter
MIPSEKFRFLFFADLVGKRVVAADGSTLGRLSDLVAFTGEPYPPVESLVVRSGKRRMLVPWTGVEQINGTIRLRAGVDPAPIPGEPVADRVRLGVEVLDRQIVDIEGAKLVRVNDLHFLETKGQLRVAHVDIGLRGLVRRMGWQRPVDLVIGLVRPGARYLRDDAFLSWKLVQPIESAPGRVRVEATKKALASLHPADLAEIIEELDLEEVPPERAADILEEMAPDESADVLSELPGEARQEILEAMERPEAEEVQELLAYPPHSVGGLMTPDRVQVHPEQTAADAIAEVRRRSDEIPLVYEVFLVDQGGVLLGYFTLKDLLLADPATPARDLAREAPVTVAALDRLRDVAAAASKYNLISVPVVDKLGVLRGIVTVDDILAEVVDDR